MVLRPPIAHGSRAQYAASHDARHVRVRAGDQQHPEAHLVGGALAPHDVPLLLALERRQLVPQPTGRGGRSPGPCRRARARTGSTGLGALVVEVPDRDVEDPSRPAGCRGSPRCVMLRPSRCMWPATPRIVVGSLDLPVRSCCRGPASLGPQRRCSRLPVWPEPSPNRCDHVGDRGLPARTAGPSAWPGRQGSSTGAGSSIVSSGVEVAVAAARAGAGPRTCRAAAPASRL